MHQPDTCAAQKNKSVFVQMSGRSAEAARLVQQAADPRQEQPAEETKSLHGWAASTSDHVLQRLAAPFAPWRDLSRSQAVAPTSDAVTSSIGLSSER